jgi:hypothetical protein
MAKDKYHRYSIAFFQDGDYVIYHSSGGEHCRWMIPGTQLED